MQIRQIVKSIGLLQDIVFYRWEYCVLEKEKLEK